MTEVREQAPRIIKASVTDANARAAAILSAAREQAEAIVTSAHAEAHALREHAEREGAEKARAATAALLAEATGAREAALSALRAEAVDLVVEATGRLLRDALETDPKRIRAIVSSLLDQLGARQRCTVRVHPDDAAFVRDVLRAGPHEGVHVDADETLERGECIVDSNVGQLDARFEVQLTALHKALTEALPR